jgi:putative DNA primase/helicase
MPVDALMAKTHEAHPVALTVLRNRRLAVASESEQGKRLAEAQVKQLTGGDVITARGMRENFSEWRPTHKLVLLSNHRPRLTGADNGIRRRLRLVPFEVVIPEDKQDKALEEKLKAEAPGILRWLIEGCLEWQRRGLDAPSAISAATAEYFADEDVIAHFLAERCVLELGARVRLTDLYAAYADWAKHAGHAPMSRRALSEALAQHDVHSKKSTGGYFHCLGLRLLSGENGESGLFSDSASREKAKSGERENRPPPPLPPLEQGDLDYPADADEDDGRTGWSVNR